jgi:ubiquinone/menaquinone biosynthesis C-methylase UbiE
VNHKTKRHAHSEFSGWAESYDHHWLNRYLFEPGHALLLDEVGSLPAGRALDVGCGTGELANRLAWRGWHVVGLDLCESMVHRARHKLNGNGDRIRLAVADSEHLPFETGSFDVVTCANSFHHYPHQEAVVRELFRVLRPGGRLLLLDGWADHFLGRVIYDLVITHVEGGTVHHRDSAALEAMFKRVGFRPVSQRRMYSFFPILLTRGSVPQ